MEPIYLDNHATTKPDPRVVESMLPYLVDIYGNASSRQHEYGWKAEAAVEWGRGQLASLLGARAGEIVFTGGATESINLSLKGACAAAPRGKRHVVSVATEHRAVLDVMDELSRAGYVVSIAPVDHSGLVSPEVLEDLITDETVLVSVMLANNEIGTLGPVADIAARCHRRGVLVHTDATQAVGHILVNVEHLGVDLLSCSAHKMYGPKGVGALYVRGGSGAGLLRPQMHGGGQERGLRSGTPNVPGIVGFGRAAQIAREEMEMESVRVGGMRDLLVERLREALPDITENGCLDRRLPHNASITFHGALADAVMMAMKGVAVSSGSACSSNLALPSHVLQAIGLDREAVLSTVRFGLSRFTTADEIAAAADRTAAAVIEVRSKRPVRWRSAVNEEQPKG